MNTKVNRILWPAILFIVLVALWALAVRFFDVKAYILPSPSDVLDVFVTESQTLKSATLATAAAAGLGFLISVIAGVSIAILFSQSALIRMSCYPYAIFLQTMPIVAVAPLIVLWFGFGFRSFTFFVIIKIFFAGKYSSITKFFFQISNCGLVCVIFKKIISPIRFFYLRLGF